MSCDLRDPAIRKTYSDIANNSQTDWMMLGYRDTRDRLHLYQSGSAGLEEMKVRINAVQDEPLFGILRVEGRLLLWSWLPETTCSGVRRARALVHSRAVGSTFATYATITVSKLSSLTSSAVRQKLKLDGLGSLPPSPQPPSTPFASSLMSDCPVSAGKVVNVTSPSPGVLGILNSPPGTPNSAHLPSGRPQHTSNGHSSPSTNFHPTTSSPIQSPYPKPSSGLSGSFVSPVSPSRAFPASPASSFGNLDDSRSGPRAPNSPRPSTTSTSSLHQPALRSTTSESFNEHAGEAEASEHDELARERGARDLAEQEETMRLAEQARITAERVARVKWESEERERERLDTEERLRLEQEERERREAADRLRREETRRAEEKIRIEEEKVRKEEEARLQAEKEDLRLLMERERLEHKLKAEEEERQRTETRRLEQLALRKRFQKLHQSGEVMLSGVLTVQGGNSIYWKRRYFELSAENLQLFKSEKDKAQPLETLFLPTRVKAITENPEEASIAHSFKITFSDPDDEEYLFYTDEKDDKDLLLAGLRMSAKL